MIAKLSRVVAPVKTCVQKWLFNPEICTHADNENLSASYGTEKLHRVPLASVSDKEKKSISMIKV